MKKIILILISLFTFNFVLCQSNSWIQQNSTTSAALTDVFFVDSNTGWVVGYNGKILHTTNGGDSWYSQISGTTKDLHAVFFINSQKGWAVGGDGIVLHTTDSGINWHPQTISTTSLIKSVHFVNESLGWICCDAIPSVFKTSNGGNNWVSTGSGEYRNNSIYFLNENIGWVAGPGVAKTTNGGNTWKPCNVDLNSHSVFFINENKGWIVGSPCDAFRTIDGGSTWSPLNIQSCQFLNDIFFTDENNGWTAGDGIHKTTDGGASWSKVHSSSDFLAAFFIDSNVGWVVGNDGRIIKTTTGGVTDVNENYSNFTESFRLYQNFPNPFNQSTVISYKLPVNSNVILKVFNSLGQEIKTLVDDFQGAGYHSALFTLNSSLPSGMYFYKLQANSYSETKKLVLQK